MRSTLHTRTSAASRQSLPERQSLPKRSSAPELGPRIVFLSGGSALRAVSRVLKQYTHNSAHLITTFDSGGSSAQLRRAFAMPAIGDLRNRIVALADETVHGNPHIYRLFTHRLAVDAARSALSRELCDLIAGKHALAINIPEPLHGIVREHLRIFSEHMTEDFDLRGANVGNLLLAGAFLGQSRDLELAVATFSRLLAVRGAVHPIAEADLHLCAELADQSRVIGQHRLTGKQETPISSRVKALTLIRGLHDETPATTSLAEPARRSIEAADLICFPMGSFYSSIVANLLPSGVGRAVAAAPCPRVYVPNTGYDPEQHGMSLVDSIGELLAYVRADAGGDVPISSVVNWLLLDEHTANYGMKIDETELERMGICVLRSNLVTAASHPHVDPQRLTQELLALT